MDERNDKMDKQWEAYDLFTVDEQYIEVDQKIKNRFHKIENRIFK